ncbi:hypothetical protein ACHAWO_000073 [Cyclotella atomus]|uniref:Uncharacterized protein n=1 Tax=Cyclotella atomus TaxID=382360 RepID=A0ABD3QSH6_9STRA
MASYALGVPFYFTCEMFGPEANGAAYLMELNSGEVGAPPKDQITKRALTVEKTVPSSNAQHDGDGELSHWGEVRNVDILAWMRAQSPLGNIDIVTKPIIRVHTRKCTPIDRNKNALVQTRLQPVAPRTQVSSRALYDILRVDTSGHVIWDSSVIFRLVLSGDSLSSLDHPHAAEDVLLALQQLDLDLTKTSIAVVSNTVSPWVEFLLKSSGVPRVTSVDYNEPIICGMDWIEPKSRFGDPIKEKENMEMIKRMHKALLPGGYLLLDIPTSSEAYTRGNFYRVYNFDRLVELLRFRFEFVARIWDGQPRKGWNDVTKAPKLFPHPDELDFPEWKHRHVLVLRKV